MRQADAVVGRLVNLGALRRNPNRPASVRTVANYRDRLLHHAVVIHIEGASYRLREHTDLIPEHVRANAPISPPPAPKRRGRPPRNKQPNTDAQP